MRCLSLLLLAAVLLPVHGQGKSGSALPQDTGLAPLPTASDLDRQIGENQQNLEQTRQRLSDLESRLDQLGAREKASLARIGSLEEQISLTSKYIRQLEAQATARTQEIARVAQQIQQTSSGIRARRKDLGRRLTTIYKYGRTLPLEVVLTTKSLPEVYRKMTYLRWIARADERLSSELTDLNRQLARQRSQLADAHAELERLQDEQVTQSNALKSARKAESEMLKKVRSERESSRALAKQLEESAGKLESMVADLERRRSALQTPAGPHYFEQNKARLPWPIRGKVIAGFGSKVHPRYKTRTTNLGIDIKPGANRTVSAIAAGKVVYADQFMGYGNLVIVDHDRGFYTLYANLDEMAVGVGKEVTAGTAVGTVSDYLHFEIRRDGKPVNPGVWLSP